MELTNRRSISDKLSKYCYIQGKDSDDFIEVTEWKNGEGWDLSLIHISEPTRP